MNKVHLQHTCRYPKYDLIHEFRGKRHGSRFCAHPLPIQDEKVYWRSTLRSKYFHSRMERVSCYVSKHQPLFMLWWKYLLRNVLRQFGHAPDRGEDDEKLQVRIVGLHTFSALPETVMSQTVVIIEFSFCSSKLIGMEGVNFIHDQGALFKTENNIYYDTLFKPLMLLSFNLIVYYVPRHIMRVIA